MRVNNSAVVNLVAGVFKWSMMEEKVGFGDSISTEYGCVEINSFFSRVNDMLGRTDYPFLRALILPLFMAVLCVVHYVISS